MSVEYVSPLMSHVAGAAALELGGQMEGLEKASENAPDGNSAKNVEQTAGQASCLLYTSDAADDVIDV